MDSSRFHTQPSYVSWTCLRCISTEASTVWGPSLARRTGEWFLSPANWLQTTVDAVREIDSGWHNGVQAVLRPVKAI